MKIALAGNPNSGKTTLYNGLTGKTEYVGNWAGVTVEAKKAPLKAQYAHGEANVEIVDLPGAYAMSAYTSEEAITSDFVKKENPDAIINIVDSTNLSRSLFFTTQLIELGIPVVVALNKQDILDKKGTVVDVAALSRELGCKVVQITATSEKGFATLTKMAMNLVKENAGSAPEIKVVTYSKEEQEANDKKRHEKVDVIVKKCEKKQVHSTEETFSDRVDKVVANKFLGLPIFFVIMWGVYWFSQQGLGGYLSGLLNDVVFGEVIPTAANDFFAGMNTSPLLQALIVDGMIGGIGAVLGFLPLIMVLFFCISLLEDSGYMARVAVVMDRYFKGIGLSGKSIIPMIVGSGCAIPGVMATRTIENKHERRMASILTPFIPCGAKLPIIGLFSVVFFPESSWVGPSMYILAIALIIIVGLILKSIFKVEASKSIFIMELHEYKIPSLKLAVLSMLDKAKHFIVRAGTIILVCNTAVWFAQTYDFSFNVVENANDSILAALGGTIAPIFIPLGFVGWQLAASAVTGFIAKENVVGSLAVMFAVSEEVLNSAAGNPLVEVAGLTAVTGLAFMVFNLFTPPCFAAIGAMNAEMKSKKWLGIGIVTQLFTGYIVAMIITQVGTFVTTGAPADGLLAAIVILILTILGLLSLKKKADKKMAEHVNSTAKA